MVLRIVDDDQAVVELLWVRAAWGLSPRGDAPPSAEGMPEPAPTAERLRRDKREWNDAWTELWSAVLGHVGKPEEPGLFEALQEAPLGSVERARLLEELSGPSWRDRFGHAAFADDAYRRWEQILFEATMAEAHRPSEEHPERRSLDVLIPAWERGLDTVVVIPCSGEYTRTVGSNALCLTRAARLDRERYERALASFAR
jgi:hypothetical protein